MALRQISDAHSFLDALDIVFNPVPLQGVVGQVKDGVSRAGVTVSRLTYLNDILRRLPPAFRKVAEALIRRPVIYRLEGKFSGYLEEADGSRVELELRGQGEYSIMR